MAAARDPYRWKASSWKNAAQWRKWENVGLAPSLDMSDLVLNWTAGSVTDLQVRGDPDSEASNQGAVTGIQLERTIEGASTLTMTLRDPRGRLFSEWAKRMRPRALAPPRRGKHLTPVEVDEGWDPIVGPDLIGRAMEVHLDGAIFRLVKVAYQHASQELTLTFEDRIVYLLRRKKGERRASRGKVTRAQFVLSLIREIVLTKPPFICPELGTVQPLDKAKPGARASTRALRAASSSSSSSESSHLARPPAAFDRIYPRHRIGTAGAARLSERQVRAVAEYAGLSPTEALQAAQIAHGESDFYPGVVQDDPGDGMVGHGLWQMTPNAWGGSSSSTYRHMESLGGLDAMRNPMQCARQMKWMHDQAGGWGPWYGTRYLNRGARASGSVLAEGVETDVAGSAEGGAAGGSYRKSYQFAREANEDSWTAIQRLAEEVGWRCFVVGEVVYFMSEEQLYGRRPRYELTPESDALLDLSYDIDWGRPVSEATVTVALDRWGAPPGAVMLLSGFGPPDGRWLITSVSRDWFQPTAEVTLKQPGKQLLEPTSERSARASSTETQGEAGGDESAAGRVYQEAKSISERGLPYIWGGGHASAGRADAGTNTPSKNSGPPPGFDCSGYVGACLAAGGLGFKPGDQIPGSGTLASSWGKPGPGTKLTVWANGQHTFIEFHGMGQGKFADTSREAAPPADRGPRLRTGSRSTGGFTARHWEGL